GTKGVNVHADIGNLTGNTTYHFRVVASNPTGVTSGPDRAFKTAKVPLSLSATATPNPVVFGATATLTGTLAGTGGGGRPLQVQQNAFPFTAGFANTGNQVLTNPDGTFSIPVVGLGSNTQFRVMTADKKLLSAPVILGVSPVVRTQVSTKHVHKRHLVRFAG